MDPKDDPYYPSWLAADLLWGGLPWGDGVRATLPAFLAQYTLHDAYWLALVFDPSRDGGAVAALRWDALWTQGRVPHPGSLVARWPILLVRFQQAASLRFEGLEEDLLASRVIGSASSAASGDGRVHRTAIDDVYGGRVAIEHGPEVTLLCLSPDRGLLPLPGLA